VEISSTIPAVGTAVEKGAVLARLIPRSSNPADRASLEFGVTEAIEQHGLAVRQRERAERLVSASALPARRLLEAKAAERTANARRTAAEASLAQYEAIRQADGTVGADLLFDLRAPLTGVIASSRATRGASVEEGDVLFEVVAVDQVHVVGVVPESEVVRLRELSGAELYVSGSDQPVPLDRFVSVGRVLDARSRTASVIYELDNRELALSVGQAVELRLFVTDAVSGPAIPESAVVDDGGRPVVFVQTGGESFERRPVTLGAHEGGYVHALKGVEAGERLVSRGAYLIRLAAMSTQLPEHGHAH
jgi:RND family efflux transporter MFP subunit